MNVLGISAFERDASAALVSDGRVVAAAAEERFTRQKHDPNFPRYAIEYCLEEGGLQAHELDSIVFYEEPHTRFTRVLATSFANFPFSTGTFVTSMKAWLSRLWTRASISRELDVHPRLIEFVPHHLSHAAQAFAQSGFDDAAILVVDTVGEWAATSLCSGSRARAPVVQSHELMPFPHSLGLVQTALAGFAGFRIPGWEPSLTDLAAFGEPRFAEELRRIISVQDDGTYRVDRSFFRFDQLMELPYGRPYGPKLVELLGAPRDARLAVPFVSGTGNGAAEVSQDDQRFADIAASFQTVLEEALLGLCRRLREHHESPNLCLGGLVAQNPSAVRRLMTDGPFERVYVPSDPGDGGGAAGAALLYDALQNARADAPAPASPYVGKGYDEARDAALLEFSQPDYWIRFLKHGVDQPKGMTVDAQTYEDPAELLPGVAEDLCSGLIVGWFQGRFASGPAGLGSRLILADPANEATLLRLHEKVCGQPRFRPFGLALTAAAAEAILDGADLSAPALKWGQAAWPVKSEARDAVRAAVHADGTVRPQVVTTEDEPALHALLDLVGAAGGPAALLATSFNEDDYPIVASPADALLVFMRTAMDVVVINGLVVRKRRPASSAG